MTHFRVRQLDWKEVPGGFVAQTIFGPIAVKVGPDDDVKYETWFFDKCKEYEATSVAHAKMEARTKLLEVLRPALEIIYDGEESAQVLRGPDSDIDGLPRSWNSGQDQKVCNDPGMVVPDRPERLEKLEPPVERAATLKAIRRLLKNNPALIDTDHIREQMQKFRILPEELSDPDSKPDTPGTP